MSLEAMAWALNNSDVSGLQKLVLIGIANHDGDGGSWPTMNTLARYASTTVRTARKAVHELEQLGLIEVVIQGGGTARTPDHSRPNLYRIIREKGEVRTDLGGRSAGTGGGGPVGPGGEVRTDLGGRSAGTPEPSFNHPGTEPPLPPVAETVASADGSLPPDLPAKAGADPKPSLDDGFAEFYEAFPRHVAKGAALRAWRAARRRKAEPDRIMDGLARSAAAWAAEDPPRPKEKIPYPATWLNAESYDDELPDPSDPNGNAWERIVAGLEYLHRAHQRRKMTGAPAVSTFREALEHEIRTALANGGDRDAVPQEAVDRWYPQAKEHLTKMLETA